MPLDDDLRKQLSELEGRGRLRETRSYQGTDRAHPQDAHGHAFVAFCSNDYLGLAHEPILADAAARAAERLGWGAGSSRLVSGDLTIHRELETALARWVGQPDALLFPTGYQTNIGVLTALASPADLIASDAANHASIVDGCRLSRAKTVVYSHADPGGAERALATPGPFRRRILVTESLFSMDGDRAPLAFLATIARKYDALLIVDEAHALGAAGPSGRGICAAESVQPDLLVGTLGKAFGVMGGFVAGATTMRSILVNHSRTFIYTTSLPAPVVAAAQAALQVVSGPEGDRRRRHLGALATRLRSRLDNGGQLVPGQDLILPLRLGDDRSALAISAALLDMKILVPAIRPPTVPEGTARLRITLSATHTEPEVDRLADALTTLLGAPASRTLR